MEATLRVAAAHGIAAVSYRRVVTEAGMSLGAASYHFDDFDDLVLESFNHFGKKLSVRYREALTAIRSEEELVEAVLTAAGAVSANEQDTVLVLTLYSEASRNPAFKQLVSAWSREVKQQIAHVVDEPSAARVGLIWDGALLQRAVSDRGLSDDELRGMIRGALSSGAGSTPARD